MALFIDFKSGVDEYYRNQAKDSPWSSILSSLEKGYTKANYDLNKQAQQNNALAVQSGQKAVTDLYTSYLQNRKSIEGAGFSSTFASQSKKALGADIGAMGKGVYQQAVAQGSTQAQQAQMSTNPIYQAYQKQVEGVGNVWSNVLSYFNAGEEGVDDVTYAETSGITKDGQLTAKGRAYLKYYMGQQSVNAEDTYLSGKGTLENYLKTNVKDVNSDWIKTLGAMSGVNLDNITYTDEERREITGLTAENTVTPINIGDLEIPARVADSSDPLGWFAQNVLGINKTVKLDKPISYAEALFEDTTGGITAKDGKKYSFLYGENESKTVLENLRKNSGLGEEAFMVNGMTPEELIKFGLLADGDEISLGNKRFVMYNGSLRFVYDKAYEDSLPKNTRK